ncbi:hypothetical protein [Bradyrhizobium japonicum]|uniref:hypothetical protein n=1 Tax=Bradyrhizobium japonicum TaxID=375 RepID=UPI001E511BE3|nr:hypothetical protein [Bradyrhizobium japonicum]MCD9824054.1 hypothetical protein [Bradyrhizobium japonicum]MCD9896608.1 hypothetical protein [Bradyrhizobium japonicum]MEB2671101.1 hypothetical protein [Bradyrhizobium japonicum]WLB28658.1 hypothetical protein QIH85_44010 [Bradyrhizobium japonicum]WRI90424.1 hypothetical protein R3F75_05545 [Bradyrhizobium japonicum]
MSEKERVDRLDQGIIEEILGLSDSEATELVGKDDVAASRKNLVQAKGIAGKLRLVRAKTDVALHVAGAATARIGMLTDGQRVLSLRKSDPVLDKKMTLAARSGRANAEADAASLDEDLAELDAWEAEDGE